MSDIWLRQPRMMIAMLCNATAMEPWVMIIISKCLPCLALLFRDLFPWLLSLMKKPAVASPHSSNYYHCDAFVTRCIAWLLCFMKRCGFTWPYCPKTRALEHMVDADASSIGLFSVTNVLIAAEVAYSSTATLIVRLFQRCTILVLISQKLKASPLPLALYCNRYRSIWKIEPNTTLPLLLLRSIQITASNSISSTVGKLNAWFVIHNCSLQWRKLIPILSHLFRCRTVDG